MLDQYRAQRIQWTTNVWPYANALFGILATIEFAWSAAVMLLERTDLQSWTSALVRKIMWIGAFYTLLLNGRIWIPAIIDSFEQIGQTSSGFAGISPSAVFAQGINIAGALMDGASTSAFFTNTGTCLALVFSAVLIVLAFCGVTIQFIVAMVESYIVVAAGFLFLGFGGSRWTAPYVERFIGLGVATGVKIMILYLLIGVGMNVSVGWIADAQQVGVSPSPAMGAFGIMGSSLIFLMLCWQAPKLFAAVLGGSPALTGGDLLATGTGVVAGAATVGSFATGGGAALAGGAASLAGVAGSRSGGGASTAITSVAGANGTGGLGGDVPPPSPATSPSPNGSPRQPSPPTNGSGGGSRSYSTASPTRSAVLSSVGGDSLTGSGFESERPASGFTTFSVPITTPRSADGNVSGDSPRGRQWAGSGVPTSESPASERGDRPSSSDAGQTQRILSGLTGRLRRARSRIGGLPSDAAPHATPPRMPIEHDE
ncbi:MAG TPA: P-type conjugative transfer protein TrbL [Bryobacteraceae bacterium]|jgi:type IV secretion system protein TrbL|nr:P-type conjugative transfer protein TrbL [Bryobacteraceae bacterium]